MAEIVTARAASARRDQALALSRVLAVAGVACLPVVFVEPAPSDLLLVACAALVLVWNGFQRTASILGLLYLLAACVSAILGLADGYGERFPTLRYLAVEFYFVFMLLGVHSLVAQGIVRTETLVRAYILGALASSVLILVMYFGDIPGPDIYRDGSRTRVKGFFKDPNVLAPFLVLPILAGLFAAKELSLGVLRVGVLFGCGFLLLITFSRGGYVAVIAAIAFVAFLQTIRSGRVIVFVGVALLLVLFCGAIYALALVYSEELAILTQLLNRLEVKAYDDRRFDGIANALSAGLEHPFGMGPFTFAKRYDTFVPHNLLAGKLVDSGLYAGMLLVLLPIAATFRTSLLYVRAGDRVTLVLAGSMAAQLVAALVVYAHHWRHMLILTILALVYVAPAIPDSRRSARAA